MNEEKPVKSTTLTTEQQQFWEKVRTILQQSRFRFKRKDPITFIDNEAKTKEQRIQINRLFRNRNRETLLPGRNKLAIKQLKSLFGLISVSLTEEQILSTLKQQIFIKSARVLLRSKKLTDLKISSVWIGNIKYSVVNLLTFLQQVKGKIDQATTSQLDELLTNDITANQFVLAVQKQRRRKNFYTEFKILLEKIDFLKDKKVRFLDHDYDFAIFFTKNDEDKLLAKSLEVIEDNAQTKKKFDQLIENKLFVKNIVRQLNRLFLQVYWLQISEQLKKFPRLPLRFLELTNGKRYFMKHLFSNREKANIFSHRWRSRRQLRRLFADKVTVLTIATKLKSALVTFNKDFWKSSQRFLNLFADLDGFTKENLDAGKVKKQAASGETFSLNLLFDHKDATFETLDEDTKKQLKVLISLNIEHIWRRIYELVKSKLEADPSVLTKKEKKMQEFFWNDLQKIFKQFKHLYLTSIDNYSLQPFFKNKDLTLDDFLKTDGEQGQFAKMYQNYFSVEKLETELWSAFAFLEELTPNQDVDGKEQDLKAVYWEKLSKVLQKFAILPSKELSIEGDTYQVDQLFAKAKAKPQIAQPESGLRFREAAQLDSLVSANVASDQLETALTTLQEEQESFWTALKPFLKVFVALDQLPGGGTVRLPVKETDPTTQVTTTKTKEFTISQLFANFKVDDSQSVATLSAPAKTELTKLVNAKIANAQQLIYQSLLDSLDTSTDGLTEAQQETVRLAVVKFYWQRLRLVLDQFTSLPLFFYEGQYQIDLLFRERKQTAFAKLSDLATEQLFALVDDTIYVSSLKTQLQDVDAFLKELFPGTDDHVELRKSYWENLTAVLTTYTVLPLSSVTLDQVNYLLEELFAISTQETAPTLNEERLLILFEKFLINKVDLQRVATVLKKAQTIQDTFWQQLKSSLQQFKVLPSANINIDNIEYSLVQLFAQKDADTAGSLLATATKTELLDLLAGEDDPAQLNETILNKLKLTYWNQLKNVFRGLSDSALVDSFEFEGTTYTINLLKTATFGNDNAFQQQLSALTTKFTPGEVRQKLSSAIAAKRATLWTQLQPILKRFLFLATIEETITFEKDYTLISIFANSKEIIAKTATPSRRTFTFFDDRFSAQTSALTVKQKLEQSYWSALRTVLNKFSAISTYSDAGKGKTYTLTELFQQKTKINLPALTAPAKTKVDELINDQILVDNVETFLIKQAEINSLWTKLRLSLPKLAFLIPHHRVTILSKEFNFLPLAADQSKQTIATISLASKTVLEELLKSKSASLSIDNLVSLIEDKFKAIYWNDLQKQVFNRFFTLPTTTVNISNQTYSVDQLFVNKSDAFTDLLAKAQSLSQFSALFDASVSTTTLKQVLLQKYWTDLRAVFAKFVVLPVNTITNEGGDVFALEELFKQKSVINVSDITNENSELTKLNDLVANLTLVTLENLLFVIYYQKLQLVFAKFSALPLETITIDKTAYSLVELFKKKDQTFSTLNDVEMQKLTDLAKNIASTQLENELNVAVDVFWNDLKRVLQKFIILPSQPIIILDQSYSLTALFAQKASSTTGSQLPDAAKTELFALLKDVTKALLPNLQVAKDPQLQPLTRKIIALEIELELFKLYWADLSALLTRFSPLPISSIVFANTIFSLVGLAENKEQSFLELASDNRNILKSLSQKTTIAQIETALATIVDDFWTDLKQILQGFLTLPNPSITFAGQSYSLTALFSGRDSSTPGSQLPDLARTELLSLSKDQVSAQIVNLELYESYWQNLRSVFAKFIVLPLSTVTINNNQYPLSELFREKDNESLLVDANYRTLVTFVSQITTNQIEVALSQAVDTFWTNVKTVFKEFPTLAQSSLTIAKRSYPLVQLFANRNTQIAGSNLPEQAKAQLLNLMNENIDIATLESELFKGAIVASFTNYSGLAFSKLFIKDSTYDVANFFPVTDSQTFKQRVADSKLFNDLKNKTLTLTELQTALDQTKVVRKELLEQILQLLPFWESTKSMVALSYEDSKKQAFTFDIKQVISEIENTEQLTWEKIVATTQATKQSPSPFSQTTALIEAVIANQISKRLLQLLLWNPVQRWLKSDPVLPAPEKVTIEEQTYDFTPLVKAKNQQDWNQLDPESKKVLATLTSDKVTPNQLKSALNVVTKPSLKTKSTESNILAIGLATVVGGSIGLTAIGGFFYWVTKTRK